MGNYQTSSEATTSSHVQTRLAWPLSDKTQICTAQDIADNLSVFFEQHLHPFAYVLLLQNWVWSYYAVLKISSNAEIVSREQTVMTRVAGDLQSSRPAELRQSPACFETTAGTSDVIRCVSFDCFTLSQCIYYKVITHWAIFLAVLFSGN